MFKLGCCNNEKLMRYDYPHVYELEQTSGPERIKMGLATNHVHTILEFTALLTEPFYILYVLHTSRANSDLGRYQSKAITYKEVSDFFNHFKDFLKMIHATIYGYIRRKIIQPLCMIGII